MVPGECTARMWAQQAPGHVLTTARGCAWIKHLEGHLARMLVFSEALAENECVAATDHQPLTKMSLSDASIRNPVFAVMLSAAMIVFGYMGYRDMGISQFPEIDFPVVNVTTYREAALPETMDSDVTDIIEDAVSGVEGIDYMTSQSLQGTSVVTIFFHLHRNIDVAMQDVQNAVAAAANRLPTDIDPPIISQVNFNKFPVM